MTWWLAVAPAANVARPGIDSSSITPFLCQAHSPHMPSCPQAVFGTRPLRQDPRRSPPPYPSAQPEPSTTKAPAVIDNRQSMRHLICQSICRCEEAGFVIVQHLYTSVNYPGTNTCGPLTAKAMELSCSYFCSARLNKQAALLFVKNAKCICNMRPDSPWHQVQAVKRKP